MEKKEARFAWMATAMPRIVTMVADKRRLYGDTHVTECVKRGLAGEPGWFFAREGVVSVGTPDAAWGTWPEFVGLVLSADQALLFIRTPEVVASGAH